MSKHREGETRSESGKNAHSYCLLCITLIIKNNIGILSTAMTVLTLKIHISVMTLCPALVINDEYIFP